HRRAPSAARRRASTSPSPREPPVITTTRPAKSMARPRRRNWPPANAAAAPAARPTRNFCWLFISTLHEASQRYGIPWCMAADVVVEVGEHAGSIGALRAEPAGPLPQAIVGIAAAVVTACAVKPNVHDRSHACATGGRPAHVVEAQ